MPRISAGNAADSPEYVLQEGLIATRATKPQAQADTAAENIVAELDDDESGPIVVYRASQQTSVRAPASELLPVYSTVEGGPVAVPTGRIYLQMSDKEPVESLSKKIEAAGFRIAQVPHYAPHTAWLEPQQPGVLAAFDGLAKLRELPHVERAEMQMLRERAERTA